MTPFWKHIETALQERNISEAELSKRIGLTQASITGWKLRDAIPRADIAYNTAKALGTTVEYLMEGIDTKEHLGYSFIVPVLNQELSAGSGSMLPEQDVIKGLVSLPYFLREYGDNIAGLYVHGDSMSPTLENGDLVICSSTGWDNEEGIYAVRFNGNGYVKRIQVGAGKIIIRSDNPKYEPIEEPAESENFEIIGKVLLVIKKV